MTLLEFLKRAHRWTGGASIPGLSDPLAALASLVRTTPASPRARVVLRVLIALRDGAGEFEEKDVWALDSEAQQLLTAFLNDHLEKRYSESHFAAVVRELEQLEV
jgi:hypothetical protein